MGLKCCDCSIGFWTHDPNSDFGVGICFFIFGNLLSKVAIYFYSFRKISNFQKYDTNIHKSEIFCLFES